MTAEQQGAYSWIGPPSYDNWQVALRGMPALWAFELPLLSDAYFVGQPDPVGPYAFFNLVAGGSNDESVRAALALRFEMFIEFEPPQLKKTDLIRYHGGEPADEIAALASLLMGCRLFAGAETRRFEPGGDPRGRPVGWRERTSPILHPSRRSRVLPSARGQHSLMSVAALSLYPQLKPDAAITLVRAARLYQDALWLAESEPELAWLLLVSAVETTANFWSTSQDTPLTRLRAAKPELVEVLTAKGGDELAERVAQEFADTLGATKKFVSFVLHYLPPPPPVRPAEWGRVEWDSNAMAKILRKIYAHRSRALHEGIPFPSPMCESPFKHETWETVAERPSFIAASRASGIWVVEDTPMYLQTFEYITRHCLIAWWKQLATSAVDGSDLLAWDVRER